MRVIPYGRQDINEADVAAVVEVLHSDWLTQGPAIERFELAVAEYCGAAHAVAVNSATSALHIACLALELGPGDRLWTSPNTFVASANCGLYCGATVDFVDIDSRTWNISIEALREKLILAERSGTLPKILVPVHFAGQSCDMAAIRELADQYRFCIIEDASHAIGGGYRNGRVGSCQFSDIAVFSFHPVKIVTTGEGGMALTNDPELAERLRRLRSHGITRDPERMAGPAEGPWYYEQIELGFNFRMTDIQAALGISQMNRLDAFVARRQELANRYAEELRDMPLALPWVAPGVASAFHLYPVVIDSARTRRRRKEVFESLRQRGIGVNVHYIPVYLQPYYRRLGFATGYCPEAERYYANAMSLPLYAALTDEDHASVSGQVREVLA
jgi:UDP-4-amino-4,6-dideoxy-N-acetyl-beta-L-altrosamine transaminase